jgi:hypothetical protein
MLNEKVPLTKQQKQIMEQFYAIKPTKVILNKAERVALWDKATARSNDIKFDSLYLVCPALAHQIRKSYQSEFNIQSAVFSECVYAQTFANMMDLNFFVNCYEDKGFIPKPVDRLLESYHLVPRYVYSTTDKKKMLIQAGSNDGIDSALITVLDLEIFTIEFKEPSSKTSEPDLPKYNEDGLLKVTKDWVNENPQFAAMLREHTGLNFFEVMGTNINNFSKESIDIAVSNNYAGKKKYADVICTEDISGVLVMLPTNQVSIWAKIEGEIRPAGRNHYKVWTPLKLIKLLKTKGATILNDSITISKAKLEERKERGGNRTLSGYKISPLFFVYVGDCIEANGMLTFKLSKIRQLNPTITAKMFFKRLTHMNVKNYYYF